MRILNVLIHMTGVAKKQEINGCMCWMTLPEVHLIAHKTIVVQGTETIKQIELIIGLCMC